MGNLPTVEQTIGLVRQFPTPEFLLRPFFPEVGIDGKIATWDIYPNSRERAKYVAEGAAAARQARKALSHHAQKMAHIRIARKVEAKAKYDRRPGGNQSQAWSIHDQIADELEDINRTVEYGKECERAAAIFGGIASLAYDDGTCVKVDYFTSTSTHYAQVTSGWSMVTRDILGDISSHTNVIREDAGAKAVAMIWGRGTARKVMNNTTVQNYIEHAPEGRVAVLEGRLTRLAGLDVIEYLDGFMDGTTWTPFVPDDLVGFVCAPEQMGTMMLQGEAEEVQAVGNPGRFAKTYEIEDPSGVIALVDDNSLPVIEVPRAISVLNIANP